MRPRLDNARERLAAGVSRWAPLLDAIAWPAVRERLGLSPRETEVCRALLQGQAVAGVAFQLGMAEGTVKTHIRRVYRKLDVGCRCELLLSVLAAERGVATRPGRVG